MQPCGGVAPRPVVGFGDIATKSGHEGFEIDAALCFGELLVGIGLADLVGIDRPEGIEIEIARFFLLFLPLLYL